MHENKTFDNLKKIFVLLDPPTKAALSTLCKTFWMMTPKLGCKNHGKFLYDAKKERFWYTIPRDCPSWKNVADFNIQKVSPDTLLHEINAVYEEEELDHADGDYDTIDILRGHELFAVEEQVQETCRRYGCLNEEGAVNLIIATWITGMMMFELGEVPEGRLLMEKYSYLLSALKDYITSLVNTCCDDLVVNRLEASATCYTRLFKKGNALAACMRGKLQSTSLSDQELLSMMEGRFTHLKIIAMARVEVENERRVKMARISRSPPTSPYSEEDYLVSESDRESLSDLDHLYGIRSDYDEDYSDSSSF